MTLPAARRFARELILEYLDLFPGRYWHGGADEYLLPGDYALYPQLAALRARPLRPAGHRRRRLPRLRQLDGPARAPRAAGRCASGTTGSPDGRAVKLRRDVVVEWWADHAGPGAARAARGGPPDPERRLVADLLRGRGRSAAVRPSMRIAYESWAVNRFDGLALELAAARQPAGGRARGVRAATSARSCTCGTTTPTARRAAQTERGIAPRLRVLAQKTWDSPLPGADLRRLPPHRPRRGRLRRE